MPIYIYRGMLETSKRRIQEESSLELRGVIKVYKVALWGIGEGYNLFTQLGGFEKVEVVVLVDKNMRGTTYIDNVPVSPPPPDRV